MSDWRTVSYTTKPSEVVETSRGWLLNWFSTIQERDRKLARVQFAGLGLVGELRQYRFERCFGDMDLMILFHFLPKEVQPIFWNWKKNQLSIFNWLFVCC